MLRKFYAATTDAGAGAATEVIEENVAEQKPVNMAEMMAKHGTKSDETGRRPEPIEIKEDKAEPKTEEVPKAATAKEEPKVEEKAEPQKQEPVAEKPKAEEAPIVQEKPKAEPTLDEVLKKNQPDAVLKALGFDDEKVALVQDLKDIDPKLVGIIQAWKSGKLGEYVKELSTDYSKMEAEDVMRHQLQVEYPKASQKQLDILYKREVVDAYNLDSDDPDEVEEGKLLLSAKADKYRDSFVANQDKYLLPNPPEPKKEEPVVDTAAIQAQQIEAYRKELSETPYTKDIFTNKRIVIGEGKEAFNYPVDNPQTLIDILTDGQKWIDVMYDKEGEQYIPKVETQMLVAAFAKNPKVFLSDYAKHLKSIGAKEVTEPIDNASEPNKATPAKSDPLPTSAAQAMAKHGRRVSGGS